MKSFRVILATGAICFAGCSSTPTTPTQSPGATARTTQPAAQAIPLRATVALDDMEPSVALPPGRGSSVGQPPLGSVLLYAQAEQALLDHDRATAIDSLQKAVAIDPLSYLLYRELARVYLTPTTDFSDRSIAALERAADLEPNHLDLQVDLGRQYLAKGDVAASLLHFRQALRTKQYQAGTGQSAIAEFFLATILRTESYDRAALDVYQRLARRLKSARYAGRDSFEIMPLLAHADAIDGAIADLLARAGRYDEAIDAYEEVIRANPGEFDYRTRLVHALVAARHRDQALSVAQDACIHFRADAPSIALFNEACLAAGHADGAAGALSRLHASRPNDHAILFALSDVLRNDKRYVDAEDVLASAAGREPDNIAILFRLVTLALDRGQRDRGARMLIHATAAAPDITMEVEPLWSMLASPSTTGWLRWSDVKAMDLGHAEDGAKWFWVCRLAQAAHRDDVAEDALNRACEIGDHRAFYPAFFDRLERIWNRQDLEQSRRQDLTRELAAQADTVAGESVANELRAMAAMHQLQFGQAVQLFAHAMDDLERKDSPSLALKRAGALRKSGNDLVADALLWKVISNHPTLRDAYEDLYLSYVRRNMESQAERVITTWLANDPHGVTVWRIQAIQLQRQGRDKAAETTLLRLFNEHSDYEALNALSEFYMLRHQAGLLAKVLQPQHVRQPWNIAVSSALVEAMATDHRVDEARHVIDDARAAAGSDADMLYSIAGLYSRIGAVDKSERTLSEVLKLDPTHPGAANDLAYLWVESGKNVLQAEALAGRALAAEPHNSSYLDSMGWFFYKRGKFAQARQFFDRAIGKGSVANPVVLNHRGDTLYRLGDKPAAGADWQQAQKQIAAMKPDDDGEMKALGKILLEKSTRLQAQQPVNVAPLWPGSTTQP